ncbi:MAG TPA: adenosylcobalamin-dependent ribonucleoside-diphosphate reductase [Gemmatimonadales bacterium]|nr:adenosylcobalamin-dependent ribonucleoside-diphosphate reductase [Gemmatimonadales bacterium]
MKDTLDLSRNALRVLEARYLLRDGQRRVIETPAQLFERVATAIAQAEEAFGSPKERSYWADRFHGLLTSRDFIPNSPTLMNAGTALGQLSACFVLPIEDTMESIFEAVKQMALVQRTGGGTGFAFSALRPRGDTVASTGGEASGPVSFMKIFDCATEHIKQGGKRRGANMGVLRVEHPDIMEFVAAKLERGSLSNFNTSVSVSDVFMEAAARNASYELIHPRTGKQAGRLNAGEVFRAIAEAAWQTGDPGLVFRDAINRANPTPQLGAIEATNPCGEVPLLPYESCNLGSVNLAHLVREAAGAATFDWQRLETIVGDAVRFLDDVIEVNCYPLPSIEQMTRRTRKIGLGVMGFAEALIRLGIGYDSDEAAGFAERLMRAVAEAATRASVALAERRGVFPAWQGSVYDARGLRIHNATCTAIAPTGTIGIIAGTSASIEPLFALAYRRTGVLDGQIMDEVNPLFVEYVGRHGLDTDRLLTAVRERGRLADVPGVPEDLKRLLVTALDIPAERHLAIQAAFQRHVDNSVSKTINLPPDATPDAVASAYRRAWELGLKGITIYRYGSKPAQVLELGVEDEPHHYEHASRCDPEECRI